jgi:hypothetical protein
VQQHNRRRGGRTGRDKGNGHPGCQANPADARLLVHSSTLAQTRSTRTDLKELLPPVSGMPGRLHSHCLPVAGPVRRTDGLIFAAGASAEHHKTAGAALPRTERGHPALRKSRGRITDRDGHIGRQAPDRRIGAGGSGCDGRCRRSADYPVLGAADSAMDCNRMWTGKASDARRGRSPRVTWGIRALRAPLHLPQTAGLLSWFSVHAGNPHAAASADR